MSRISYHFGDKKFTFTTRGEHCIIEATKAYRPKFRNGRQMWVECAIVSPVGNKYTGYYDAMWGTRVYFPYKKQWYAIPLTIELPLKGDYKWTDRFISHPQIIFVNDPKEFLTAGDY